MDINNEENSQLSVDQYTIDLDAAGCKIYKLGKEGQKTFICGEIGDPKTAMEIIEGLIMVEYKRFYYPDSKPTFEKDAVSPKTAVTPFLMNVQGRQF